MGSPIGKIGSAVICGPAVRHWTVPLPRNVLDLAPTICAMLAVPYRIEPKSVSAGTIFV